MKRTGGCLCGAVTFTIDGPVEQPGACHCTQCRRTSGHYWAAFSVADSDISISGETLTWFDSSDWARRGFCNRCGSSLFYKLNDKDRIEVAAGALDGPTGLKLQEHIFVADKGDYYDIADGLPQHDTFQERS